MDAKSEMLKRMCIWMRMSTRNMLMWKDERWPGCLPKSKYKRATKKDKKKEEKNQASNISGQGVVVVTANIENRRTHFVFFFSFWFEGRDGGRGGSKQVIIVAKMLTLFRFVCISNYARRNDFFLFHSVCL